MIIVNSFQLLTIITKHSILDVAAALDPPLCMLLFMLLLSKDVVCLLSQVQSNFILSIITKISYFFISSFPGKKKAGKIFSEYPENNLRYRPANTRQYYKSIAKMFVSRMLRKYSETIMIMNIWLPVCSNIQSQQFFI